MMQNRTHSYNLNNFGHHTQSSGPNTNTATSNNTNNNKDINHAIAGEPVGTNRKENSQINLFNQLKSSNA